MREYKFRAKGIRENKDKWFVGSLFVEDGMGITYIVSGVNTHYETNYLQVEVDSQTVGQSTGLTDSTGKEIYEGDIVKCDSGRICKVVFFTSACACCFDLIPVGGFDCEPPKESTLWKALTVIGNIYDNPELVGVEV